MTEVSYRNGVLTVVIAGCLWSLMGLIIRLIGDASTWQILFYRSLGMAPVLFLYIAWRSKGHPFAAIARVGLPGSIGAFGLVFAFAGAIYAFQTTTIANAAFLFAASPLFTAVLAWPLLKEPVRRATWGAILIALIGIILMVREGLAAGAMIGNLAALGSAIGFSAFTISLRWGRLKDMLPAVMLGGVLSVLVGGVILVASGEGLSIAPGDAALAVTMGIVTLGGGMVAYTIGSRALPAAELALLSLVEVMLAPVWVWLFLSETAGLATLIGGAVLAFALMFNALTGLRHRHTKVI